ncbi:MAG: MAPEG family protein [Betaproteobacteria bacterium]|nr:MAPEG family protein [Betaproteobacteria bacterium]
MNPVAERWLLYPLLAMALLTFAVGTLMYRRRVAEIRRKGVRLQSIASSAGMAATLEDTRASDNFRNLFEVPVLFYAGVLVAYAAHLASPAYLAVAWAFVAARIVHSAIQCTTNRVRYRFLAFVTGFWLVAALWALLGWDLVVAGKG